MQFITGITFEEQLIFAVNFPEKWKFFNHKVGAVTFVQPDIVTAYCHGNRHIIFSPIALFIYSFHLPLCTDETALSLPAYKYHSLPLWYL